MKCSTMQCNVAYQGGVQGNMYRKDERRRERSKEHEDMYDSHETLLLFTHTHNMSLARTLWLI